MTHSLRALALVLLFASPPALAQEAAGLAFGWELPSRATVTQETLKKGRQIAIRYQIELSRAGDELRLGVDELELLSVDGQDLTTPAMRPAAAQQAAQMLTAYPRLRISPEGDLLGIEDWEAHVERCCEVLSALGPNVDPQILEQTRTMMLDPRYRGMLEAKSGEHWQVWVASWIGLALAPGEVRQGVTEIPLGETPVEAKLILERAGDRDDGQIRLTMTTLLEGPKAEAAFRAFMLELTKDGPNPMPEDFRLDAFSKESVVTVTTDPNTLRPSQASSESRMKVEIDGDGGEQVERQRYTFEWE